jgi:hypothetical protein
MDAGLRNLSTLSKVSELSSNILMIGSIRIELIIRLNYCLKKHCVFCQAYQMKTAF